MGSRSARPGILWVAGKEETGGAAEIGGFTGRAGGGPVEGTAEFGKETGLSGRAGWALAGGVLKGATAAGCWKSVSGVGGCMGKPKPSPLGSAIAGFSAVGSGGAAKPPCCIRT